MSTVVTLSDLTKDGQGHYGIGASAVPFSDNLLTYLRITDINDDGTLNKNNLMSVNDEKAKDYLLHPNDIVFARTGASTGRNYFYNEEDGNLVYAGFLIKFSIDPQKVNPKFIKYYCQSDQYKAWITSFSTGSTRGNINAKTYAQMPIPMIDREKQDLMVKILSSLDEKIRINNKITQNLEQQARALFKSWFVDFEPFGGTRPPNWYKAQLSDFVEIKRGGSPRPIKDYLSSSGLRWLKISDATSINSPYILNIKEHIKEEGLQKTVFLHAGSLVLSNSATPGIPKILDVDSCIHDGWLYFPSSQFSKYYLYLFFKYIRNDLVALGNGSVFTNLKTDILKAYPILKADDKTLHIFDELIGPIFERILNCERENKNMELLRDTLLPKLMSGEMDVSSLDI